MSYPTKVNLNAVKRFEETTGLTFLEVASGNIIKQPLEVQLKMLHSFVYEADNSIRWKDFEREMMQCTTAAEYLHPLQDALGKFFGAGKPGESAQP